MKEEILHLVWKYQLVNHFNCYSVDGERVDVVSPGKHNVQDAGPDFWAAKIRVGGVLWVGNVEIHVKTSDWYEHLHHFDPSYDNVVLHVVYEDDCGAIEGVKQYPILELKKCVNKDVWDKIGFIETSRLSIPCKNDLSTVGVLDWISWQDSLVTERFQRKVEEVQLIYALSAKDWESVVFQLIAKSLGGTVNKEPFLILSKQLNIGFIRKHRDKLFVVESILFGASGLLDEDFSDKYPKELKREYLFYKAKFSLYEMERYWWKWLRLRPSSFPTIQIAMLASLIHNLTDLELLFQSKSFDEFRSMIQRNTCLTFYWENHYKFDVPSKEKTKNWGEDLVKRMYVNAVLPYQIAKDKLSGSKGASFYLEKLTSLKAEDNKIIRNWKQLNIPISSCYESQAMIQLNKEYCSRKKCLNCRIGLRILKHSIDD